MPPSEIDDERPPGEGDPNADPQKTGENDGDPGSEGGGEGADGGGAGGEEGGEEGGERKEVPIKNRLAEAERKRQKAEREAAEERARREQAEEQARQLAAAMQSGGDRAGDASEQKTEEEELSRLLYEDPKEYHRRIAAKATREATESARVATRFEMGQQAKLKAVLEEFPELQDTDSEFFRDVALEYEAKKRYHGLAPGQHDAVLFEDAANKVDRNRSKKARRSSGGADPQPPITEGGGPRGGGRQSGGGDRAPRKGELTPARRQIAQDLGLSEKEAKDAYTHYSLEEV